MRLTKHETNDLIFRLEERKYGRRFNSMELAQKADIPLDDVNRLERQLPIENPRSAQRLAQVLGVTTELLRKVGGLEEISTEELHQLDSCLVAGGEPLRPECEQLGLR